MLNQREIEEMFEKVALISGWSLNRVHQTGYLEIMDKMVKTIEFYEKFIQEQNKTIEDHRKTLAKVDDYLIVLSGLSK